MNLIRAILAADVPQLCTHNVFFAVPKSSGEGLRTIVNCSKPSALSVNNFVDEVSTTFYRGVDDIANDMVQFDYIATIDIWMPIMQSVYIP